jgi:hypothetical protein
MLSSIANGHAVTELAMIKSAGFWFLVLLAVCIIGPYALRVRPTTHRQWTYVTITIAFVAWVLFMVPLRSR